MSDTRDLLQQGLDLLDEGFTLMDSNHRLVVWNRAFFELLDLPPDLAQVGTPFDAFIRFNAMRGEYGPGDPQEQIRERIDAAQQAQSHYFERQRPNGRIIAVKGEPIGDNAFITLYSDVTEARRAERLILQQNAELESRVAERTLDLEQANERLRAINALNLEITEALRRSEGRMRIITDSIPAFIAYVDAGYVYRFANKGYAQWFGFTKESIIGKRLEDVVGPTLYAFIGPQVSRALTGERIGYEYGMTRPDGTAGFARSNLVPDIDGDGKVAGVFVLATDVTADKTAQSALLHATRMETVGHLAGGLAHDFNNLLTILLGNLNGLREALGDRQDLHRFIDPSLNAIRLGADVVRKLVGFSRRPVHESDCVDVAARLRDLTPLLNSVLSSSIRFATDLGPGPLLAHLDRNGFETALINLVINARDAMPDGGTIRVEASRIEHDGRSMIRVSVTDNGSGMDAETLGHAFEPFFTTKPAGTGSGLGLAMIRRIVEDAGGSVRLSSTPGVGTTVEMMFLGLDESSIDSIDVPHHAPQRTPPRLVLLVEDNADVRRTLREYLVALGHSVIEAGDGVEGLALLQSLNSIELLVSDISMPGLRGTELASRARALRPDIKILLVSGQPEADAPLTFRLLLKPFSRDELAHALVQVENEAVDVA